MRWELRRLSSVSRTRIHWARWRDLEAEQLFDGQAVTEIVGERIEVVDAVGERNHLLVELGLAGLLDAGMQVADLGTDADDDFAVDLDDQAQHAMRGGVLRAHVQNHAALARAIGFREFEDGRAAVLLVISHSAVSLHGVILAQWDGLASHRAS